MTEQPTWPLSPDRCPHTLSGGHRPQRCALPFFIGSASRDGHSSAGSHQFLTAPMSGTAGALEGTSATDGGLTSLSSSRRLYQSRLCIKHIRSLRSFGRRPGAGYPPSLVGRFPPSHPPPLRSARLSPGLLSDRKCKQVSSRSNKRGRKAAGSSPSK